MEKYIIGVDVGLRGGIAVIDLCSEELVCYKPFSEENYIDIFKKYQGVLYIEQVHAFSGQGVTSMFHFGENFGLIKGMALATNHEIKEVSPQRWKKYFLLDNDKQKSIDLAHKFFDIDINIGKRKIIESDGMAEAILIALYGKEIENGI